MWVLLKKLKKKINIQPNLHAEKLGKEKEMKPTVCKRKETIKISEEISKMKTKIKNPKLELLFSSVQFSSVIQSCPNLCNPMNCSTPGLPVHHQLPEFTQTHVH